MIGGAYLKDTTIRLRFEWGEPGGVEGVETPLGQGLMAFARMPPDESEKQFGALASAVLRYYWKGESHEETQRTLGRLLDQAFKSNVYTFLFAQAYAEYLMLGLVRPAEAWEHLRKVLPPASPLAGTAARHVDPGEMAVWGKDIVTQCFQERQRQLLDDLDAIHGARVDWADFSPMQRLYLLTLSGRRYLTGEFTTTFAPDASFSPGAGLEAAMRAILKENAPIVEFYNMETIDDLIGFELFSVLKTGLLLKKCRNCGGYFIPQGRSDTEYCDHIPPGEAKPCFEAGPARQYQLRHADNPVYREFNRAYKRNNNRVRYGKMRPDDFFAWSEAARRKRDACAAGETPLVEFRKWLGNK